ncbi:MAG: hemerythrin domain-containing protein [Bacteroidetes bacterium]|nr:hemerythrin domain-containing protein [Bacteroidota bacterium]
MKYYETVFEALTELHKKGYTLDFSILDEQDCIYCHNQNHSLSADEFVIDEIYRFEGDTDPGDEMIVYAISSSKHNLKGVLTNAYGIYSDSKNSKIVEKLKYKVTSKIKPIKRNKELIGLSREHHHVLLLSWKIKAGLSKNIEFTRIKNYLMWFYENHILPHFEIEEKYLFPLLDKDNVNLKIALEHHRQIVDLIENIDNDKQSLAKLHVLLTEHVRFEERILFDDIQKNVSSNNIILPPEINEKHEFCDNETDPFWR